MTSNAKEIVTVSAEYLAKNKSIGLEELTQDDLPTPTLSVVHYNSKLVDSEGRPYPRGHFFYKGDNSCHKEVECSLLGYTKKDLPNFSDKTLLDKNYIFMGAIEPGFKPFLMYFKKTGIRSVKTFLDQVVKMNVPMYALKLKLTTEARESQTGAYFIIHINIIGVRDNAQEVFLLEKLARQYGSHITTESEAGNDIENL